MSQFPQLRFSSTSAQIQYRLLMGLFHIAITRGLYGRFARGLGRFFPDTNWVSVQTKESAPFRVRLNDGYWTRFLLYHRSYEPEVGNVLKAASGHTPLFCDLGANTGYWTTRAAPHFPQIIAVEAAKQTFLQLRENTRILPNVTLHQAAIFSHSGEKMSFINVHNSHASARLRQNEALKSEDQVEMVTTLAIDQLIPVGTAALIKLDVEGAEIAAIKGGKHALEFGSVLIYEDHGSDHLCAPTAHLLGVPEICVYALGESLIRIRSVQEAQAIKTDRYKGYNFLAAHVSSPLLMAILKEFAKPAEIGQDMDTSQGKIKGT